MKPTGVAERSSSITLLTVTSPKARGFIASPWARISPPVWALG
jgi:hypothetical protein